MHSTDDHGFDSKDTQLNQQRASITSAMLQMAKRREEEYAKKVSREAQPAAAGQLSAGPQFKELLGPADEGGEPKTEESLGETRVSLDCGAVTPLEYNHEQNHGQLGDSMTSESEPDDKEKDSDTTLVGLGDGAFSPKAESERDQKDELTTFLKTITKLPPTHSKVSNDAVAQNPLVLVQAGKETSIERSSLLYAVAIQLHNAEVDWDTVRRWTTHLFSSGLNSYEAQQEKERILAESTENLHQIMSMVLKEPPSEVDIIIEERTKLVRRIIVDNIAADAQVEDLLWAFRDLCSEIHSVQMLEEREPIRRTRVAYINMCSRDSAMEACLITMRYIFGLKIKARLAIEKMP